MCTRQTTLWSLRLVLGTLRSNPRTLFTVQIRGTATLLVSYPGSLAVRLRHIYFCKHRHYHFHRILSDRLNLGNSSRVTVSDKHLQQAGGTWRLLGRWCVFGCVCISENPCSPRPDSRTPLMTLSVTCMLPPPLSTG